VTPRKRTIVQNSNFVVASRDLKKVEVKLKMPGRPGTICSRAIRPITATLRTAAVGLVCVAAGWYFPVQSSGVTVYLKNGDSYHDVEIVRSSDHSLTVRTYKGHIKFLKQHDIAEIVESAAVWSAPPPKEAVIMESVSHGLYAFRDASGKISFTNKPEQYDPNIYEPMHVPLGQAQFYRSQRSSKVTVQRRESKLPPEPNRPTNNIKDIIDFHATRKGLSQALVKAVIQAESAGNQYAVSHCGACGLMQLMPATAAEMGIYDIFDPDQNIAGGTEYLAKMLELFNGDKRLALAAYNAGPGAVKKYRGIPPYRETRQYVDRVLRFERKYVSGRPFRLAAASVPQPTAVAPPAEEQQEFAITLTSGYTIRGNSYRPAENGIYLWTRRKWEFVRNDLIEETNFT